MKIYMYGQRPRRAFGCLREGTLFSSTLVGFGQAKVCFVPFTAHHGQNHRGVMYVWKGGLCGNVCSDRIIHQPFPSTLPRFIHGPSAPLAPKPMHGLKCRRGGAALTLTLNFVTMKSHTSHGREDGLM